MKNRNFASAEECENLEEPPPPESERRPTTHLPVYQPPAEATPEAFPDAVTEFPPEEADSGIYSRDQRRSRRKRHVRPKTINTERLAKSALEVGRRLHPEFKVERPRTRADCSTLPRPCPFVACRHHLYLDVSPRTGSIKLNFPDLEVWELEDSCSLDVAERGPVGAEELGRVMNLTRERIRQLQQRGLDAAAQTLDFIATIEHEADSSKDAGDLPRPPDRASSTQGARTLTDLLAHRTLHFLTR